MTTRRAQHMPAGAKNDLAPQVREQHDDDVNDDASRGTELPKPSTDLVDQLGLLDDTVFDAIAGRDGALARLRQLWPDIRSAAGASMVEESREQYVRHALHVWRDSLSGSELRDPAAAIAALDVLALLFDE